MPIRLGTKPSLSPSPRTDGASRTTVERAAMHIRAGGLQCCGGRVRAGEADDLMPRRKQLADDGGTDVSGCSGYENSHRKFLHSLDVRLGCAVVWSHHACAGPESLEA